MAVSPILMLHVTFPLEAPESMAMVDDEVTAWLFQLAGGDPQAAERIWQRYFDQLVQYARRRLEGLPCRAADEEDVALSAMHSFCRAVATHRYPELEDRHGVWKVLVTITGHKAIAQIRRQRAQMRGGGHVRGESAFDQREDPEESPGIDAVLGCEPTPELAVLMAETCEGLLERLADPLLREIALRKLEGCTNAEIARTLGVTERSIERKLNRIRKLWNSDLPED